MDFSEKYLKYKKKYFELKNTMNQRGGAPPGVSTAPPAEAAGGQEVFEMDEETKAKMIIEFDQKITDVEKNINDPSFIPENQGKGLLFEFYYYIKQIEKNREILDDLVQKSYVSGFVFNKFYERFSEEEYLRTNLETINDETLLEIEKMIVRIGSLKGNLDKINQNISYVEGVIEQTLAAKAAREQEQQERRRAEDAAAQQWVDDFLNPDNTVHVYTSQNPRGVGFGSRLYDGTGGGLYMEAGGYGADEDYGCFKSAENCLMVYIKDTKYPNLHISLAIDEEGEIKNVHLTQVQPSRNKHWYYFINNEPSKSQLRSGEEELLFTKMGNIRENWRVTKKEEGNFISVSTMTPSEFDAFEDFINRVIVYKQYFRQKNIQTILFYNRNNDEEFTYYIDPESSEEFFS